MAQPPVYGFHPFTNPTNFDRPFVEDQDDPRFYTFHRTTSTYDLNSKIMLSAIASLSFVVFLVIALHIYARCFLRRQERRRAVIRQLGLNSTRNVHELPKMGLSAAVISSLPMYTYTKPVQREGDTSSVECAVCLSFLEEQEMVRVLPNCKHNFHAECIDKWLSSRSTCPICRMEAEPVIVPVEREGPVTGSSAISIENLGSAPTEGSSNQGDKANGGSSSRLSSFRRMLSRERSSRRIQHEIQEGGIQDLERQ